MASYRYCMITSSGRKKWGRIETLDKGRALSYLKSGGNTVISLEDSGIWDAQIENPFKNRITFRDMSVFCRQSAAAIKAGIPVAKMLDIISGQTENRRLKKSLQRTRILVEGGESLSAAMKEQNDAFSQMFIHLVRAGEEAGKLEKTFENLAEYYEKTARLQAAAGRLMIYPIILSAACAAVLAILSSSIVPMYSSMFEEMGADIPFYTKAAAEISSFIGKNWYWFLLLAAAVVLACRIFLKTEKGKYFLSRTAMKIPVAKDLKKKQACARFSRNLGLLLSSGVPLPEALEITADTMDDPLFRDAAEDGRRTVVSGIGLAVSMEAGGLFPPMACHMVSIGEETGQLDAMLENLAGYYEEETETALEKAAAAAEPCLIIVMAAIVIAVIMAVYEPMITMYQVF